MGGPCRHVGGGEAFGLHRCGHVTFYRPSPGQPLSCGTCRISVSDRQTVCCLGRTVRINHRGRVRTTREKTACMRERELPSQMASAPSEVARRESGRTRQPNPKPTKKILCATGMPPVMSGGLAVISAY
jgi:hypothetical protein